MEISKTARRFEYHVSNKSNKTVLKPNTNAPKFDARRIVSSRYHLMTKKKVNSRALIIPYFKTHNDGKYMSASYGPSGEDGASAAVGRFPVSSEHGFGRPNP